MTAIMCYKDTGDTMKSKTQIDNKPHAMLLLYLKSMPTVCYVLTFYVVLFLSLSLV